MNEFSEVNKSILCFESERGERIVIPEDAPRYKVVKLMVMAIEETLVYVKESDTIQYISDKEYLYFTKSLAALILENYRYMFSAIPAGKWALKVIR